MHAFSRLLFCHKYINCIVKHPRQLKPFKLSQNETCTEKYISIYLINNDVTHMVNKKKSGKLNTK